MAYDVMIVLGHKLSPSFTLMPYTISCLQKAKELYQEGIAPKIILSGKWSIQWDFVGITPSITEAAAMIPILLDYGIPKEDIFLEEESKDTIGNAYFCKKLLIEPNNFRKIVIICEDFHVKRVEKLFKLIYGKGYIIDIIAVPTYESEETSVGEEEESILTRQLQFLSSMKEGEDSFLKDKLYEGSYYKNQFQI